MLSRKSMGLAAARWIVLLIAAVGGLVPAHAMVKQPNGEYRESMDDLSVKVLGGYVTISRTWQADDQNKGIFRWYFNPAWADLSFTYDSIDGSVKQITRADSPFTKTGTGVFVFDQVFFIKQTTNPAGWRWYDTTGSWITYDATGKITAYGNRNNVGVTFTRNADGTINEILDNNGQAVLTFTYTNGRIANISDYSGRSVSYEYTNGQLTQVTDPLNFVWKYGYTGGLLTSKTDANDHTTTINYNGNRVVKISDHMHYETNYSYDYDHFKRVYSVVETSPAGIRTETHYDTRGQTIYQKIGARVVQQLVKDGTNADIDIDERNLQTRTVYDTLRNPIEVDHPDGTKTTTTYDAVFNNVTSYTDELGVQTKYEYDSKGNLLAKTEAVGYSERRITTYTYDGYGQRLTQTIKGMVVPPGVTPGPDTQYQDATTTWTYDQYGNVHTIEDPMHHMTTITQDVMGNMISRKDARDYTTNYEYNARGWLTKFTDPLQHSTSAGYDKVGNRLTVTDALSNTTTYKYNNNDWLTGVTDPPDPTSTGGASTRDYDHDGRLKQGCDQLQVCTNYAYDGDGRLTTTTDGAGNVTTIKYGDATSGLSGLVAATLYPTYQEQYKYNLRNRRTQVIQVLPGVNGQPDQQQITATGYDPKGQVISTTDPLGRTTLVKLDALGRQIAVTDALLGVTTYSYNNQNSILTVTDANGHTHRFAYDLANRLTSEARPLGETIRYEYDNSGNLTTRTSPKGDRRVYTYDEAGRRMHEDQYPAGSNAISQSIDYAFDERNVLTGYRQTGDTESSAAYAYDAKRQKKAETVTYGSGQTSFKKTIQYDYYPNGLKQFFTFPDGTVVAYAYTANNELASVTTPDNSIIQFRGYVWNAPKQVQMPGVVRDITLDPLQRPLEIRVQAVGSGTISAPNGSIVMNYDYTYDAAGNITKRTTEDGEYDYGYDRLDRLTDAVPPPSVQLSPTNPVGVPIEHYSYDPTHNRASSEHQPGSWNYNADNQLLAYGTGVALQNFQYDSNGNTSQQVTGDPTAPSRTRNFIYNAAERLEEVDDNGSAVATYEYDPYGRRIQKRSGTSEIWYQYSDEGVAAEFNQTGSISRIFGWRPNGTWGSNPYWFADWATTKWNVSFYQGDVLGTPQRLTDGNGTVTWRALFEAFGKVVALQADIANVLAFPGQRADAETRLNYNYWRDYDPEVGRYIEIDPTALSGGINVYSYAMQNPLNSFDPRGQRKLDGLDPPNPNKNTVICKHRALDLQVLPAECGLGECTRRHEKAHKEDLEAWGLGGACAQEGSDDYIVAIGYKTDPIARQRKVDTELHGLNAELQCLRDILRDCPDPMRCREPVQRQKDRVVKQIADCTAGFDTCHPDK